MWGSNGQHFAAVAIKGIGTITSFIGQSELLSSNQVDGDVAFKHRNIRISTDFFRQRCLYGKTGSVCDVNDTTCAMPTLTGQVVACVVARKGNPLFD